MPYIPSAIYECVLNILQLNQTGLTPFPTSASSLSGDHFKEVVLLQFFFVRASVDSYLCLFLSLFVPHLSFFWCLGKAMRFVLSLYFLICHFCVSERL